jgi:hypothetical protein
MNISSSSSSSISSGNGIPPSATNLDSIHTISSQLQNRVHISESVQPHMSYDEHGDLHRLCISGDKSFEGTPPVDEQRLVQLLTATMENNDSDSDNRNNNENENDAAEKNMTLYMWNLSADNARWLDHISDNALREFCRFTNDKSCLQ